MMHPLAAKWDQRYAGRTEPGEPLRLLREHTHLLPETGRALDLACGLGANARFLAQRGFHCEGWDISSVALKALADWRGPRGEQVHTCRRDVEAQPPEPERFDLIVVSDFLHRPGCTALAAALKPGGLLFYHTWSADKCTASGPGNPDFLLGPNELLHLFPHLHVRFYQHLSRSGDLRQGDRDHASLIAQQPR